MPPTRTPKTRRCAWVDAIDQILARNNVGASLVPLSPAAAALAAKRRATVRMLSTASPSVIRLTRHYTAPLAPGAEKHDPSHHAAALHPAKPKAVKISTHDRGRKLMRTLQQP